MKFHGDIHISDSMWRMLILRRHDSDCLKLLVGGLERLQSNLHVTGYEPGSDRTRTQLQRYTGVGRLVPVMSRVINSAMPGNYFSFREKEGMISYMPKGKAQQIVEGGVWSRKGRQSMKPARWIKMMLNPRLARRIKDNVFAEFNDVVKHEELKGKLEFKLVGVQEGYTSAYFKQPISSCMWENDVAPFYEAFGCEVLVATSADYTGYVGRALVWPDVTFDGKPEKHIFMDRIYVWNNSPELTLAFREHALMKGWWTKRNQSKEVAEFIDPNGEIQSHAKVTSETTKDLTQIRFFPYCDTMAFGGDTWVSNDGNTPGKKFSYRYTGGQRSDRQEGMVQDVTGVWIPRETAVQIAGYWYRPDSALITRCAIGCNFVIKARCIWVNYIDRDHPEGLYISISRIRAGGPRGMSGGDIIRRWW